tara:strand:- start:317 stop:1216 length:900 start_codon:yes stop_codon:yes gene_type:complete
MANCNCDSGLYNLQSGTCIVKPAITRKFVFVEYFKADGTINGIDLSAPFGQTEIDALINQEDKKLRWFMSDTASNFVTERADPNTETIDNVNFITSQGIRTMTADFLASSAELAKKIDSNNCVEMGVYLIDEDNGISGILNRDGFLDPIRLEKNAFGKVVFPTEGSIFKVMFSSTWQKSVKDGDLKVLAFADHQTDLLNKRGLVDVEAKAITVVDTTSAKVSYNTIDGSAYGSPFKGLVFGDFVMENKTAGSSMTVSASVENPDGTYTITFGAATTGDLAEIKVNKAGFEFEVAKITLQ